MNLPTFIVCMMLGSCATLRDHIQLHQALKDHRASQKEFEQLYAPEIKQFKKLSRP